MNKKQSKKTETRNTIANLALDLAVTTMARDILALAQVKSLDSEQRADLRDYLLTLNQISAS